jgi:hypothetical protein
MDIFGQYNIVNFKKKVYPLIIKYSIKETFSENFNNILINQKDYLIKENFLKIYNIKKYKNLFYKIDNIIKLQ